MSKLEAYTDNLWLHVLNQMLTFEKGEIKKAFWARERRAKSETLEQVFLQ